MSHRRNPLGAVIAILLGLCLMGTAPATATPRKGPPVTVEVSSFEELEKALENATPGSVIRLAAGIYQIYAEDPYFLVKGVQGLPDQPIVIQGAPVSEDGKRATIIDGGRSLDPMRASTKPGSPCKPAKGKPTSASLSGKSGWLLMPLLASSPGLAAKQSKNGTRSKPTGRRLANGSAAPARDCTQAGSVSKSAMHMPGGRALGSQNSVALFQARNFPRPPAISGARTYQLLLKI